MLIIQLFDASGATESAPGVTESAPGTTESTPGTTESASAPTPDAVFALLIIVLTLYEANKQGLFLILFLKIFININMYRIRLPKMKLKKMTVARQLLPLILCSNLCCNPKKKS